jgi:hypothetical protein
MAQQMTVLQTSDAACSGQNRIIAQAIIFPNCGQIPGHLSQSHGNGAAFRRNGVAFRGNGVRARINGAPIRRNGVRCRNKGAGFHFNGVAIRDDGVRFQFNGASLQINGVDFCGNGVSLQNNGVSLKINGFALKSGKTGFYPQISQIFAESSCRTPSPIRWERDGVRASPSTLNPQPLTNHG